MTGVILAGGQCERMRQNKALLVLDSRPIIVHICTVLKEIFDQLILVTNDPLDYHFLGIQVVTDLIPGKGPLGGLYTGLFYASSPFVFAVACDMPFINRAVINYLVNLSGSKWDVIVPVTSKGFEPLHAIYSRKCLDKIRSQIINGELKISSLYERIRIKAISSAELSEIDPELQSCLNLNTPQEFDRARSSIRG